MAFYIAKCKYCKSEYAYTDDEVLIDNDGKEYTVCMCCNKLIVHNKSRKHETNRLIHE